MAYANPRGIRRAQERASVNRKRRLRGSDAEQAHAASLIRTGKGNPFALTRWINSMLTGGKGNGAS